MSPDNFVEMSSFLIVRHFCLIYHDPTHWTSACQLPDITEVLQCETLDQVHQSKDARALSKKNIHSMVVKTEGRDVSDVR